MNHLFDGSATFESTRATVLLRLDETSRCYQTTDWVRLMMRVMPLVRQCIYIPFGIKLGLVYDIYMGTPAHTKGRSQLGYVLG